MGSRTTRLQVLSGSVFVFQIFSHSLKFSSHQKKTKVELFLNPKIDSYKVSSVQEACAKCFAVHILKFEILKITWKNQILVFSFSPTDCEFWCVLFGLIMWFANKWTAKHLVKASSELTLQKKPFGTWWFVKIGALVNFTLQELKFFKIPQLVF
jgi:hypothetical protein